MQRILRFWKIVYVFFYFGLDQLALSGFKHKYIQWLIRAITFGRALERPRGERLRLALEALGPIFVKFGQVLSTRRDLMPQDIANELAKLQDQVPPFDSAESARIVEKALGCPLHIAFQQFDTDPIASASIAQVHFAVLNPTTAHPEWARKEVAVKVLRPGMLKVINSDLALMRDLAHWVEKLWADGKRLKPREVVGEFDKYLHEELDLIREASNASQLRRNFEHSRALIVPEIYWDWCRDNVMVMEKMKGIPISKTQDLINAGVNLHQLAIDGVEIFFTQVFRDGFFHADMHPGNIFVSIEPETFGRYIALDFGIIGTLSDFDKNYLAQNFLAFFNRDYHRVAALHIESGWVPKNTRVEELEGAVRSVCEPYFDRPLKEISLGLVLMRLFQVSRRFKVEIQPQLVLLQKTLLNIEGLGRQLDPELDLWKTAKPYLEKWMHRQLGLPAFWEQVKAEAPHWAKLLPQMPRLASQLLAKRVESEPAQTERLLQQLLLEQRRTHRLILMVTLFVGGSLGGWVLAHIWLLFLQ